MKIFYQTFYTVFLLMLAFGSIKAQSVKYVKSEAEAQQIVARVLKSSPLIDGHCDLFIRTC